MLHRPAFDLLLLAILLLTLSVTVHTDAVNLPLALRIDTPVARPSDLPAATPLPHRGGRLLLHHSSQ